jgi:hypothetical protein
VCCAADDLVDVVVVEERRFEAAGESAFGAEESDAEGFGFDVHGGVTLGGPAGAEDDVAAGVGGAAEREPVAEQVPQ